jgi:toxin ParE1/3/4
MLPVKWSTRARGNLAKIVDYIAVRNPSAAVSFLQTVQERVERLRLHPGMYQQGRTAGTREMVIHPNYIVVYRASRSEITIVAVVHTRKLDR